VETLFKAGLSNAVSATLLALVVACLGRVLARRPAVMHCLWFLVLLKLVTPPLYELPIQFQWPRVLTAAEEPAPVCAVARLERDRDQGSAEEPLIVAGSLSSVEVPIEAIVIASDPGSYRLEARGEGSATIASAGNGSQYDWIRGLATVWLAGTAATLVLSFCRVRRFQRLLREARPASEQVQERVGELASRLGLRRPPSAWWVWGKLSPLLWALGRRPRLIIPVELWKALDERQQSTLLVHELAHLRRGDHGVRIVELLVTALYWWHPVVWWARHALRDVEEECCDAWVVWAFPDSARSYAETLLETLDFLNLSDLPEPLLASGFGKVHHLRRRLTMIMSGATPRLLGVWGGLGLLGLSALLLPVNATWAQKLEKPQEVELVVKSLDDLSTASDAVARIEGSAELSLDGTIVDGDKSEVLVVLKTDDDEDEVVSGSLKEAIVKLKQEIEKTASKSPPSEKRQKALARALDELNRLAKQMKELDPSGGKDVKTLRLKVSPEHVGVLDNKDVRVVRLRRVEETRKSKLSAEEKAEIEKTRVKVKQLARELEAKRKELNEAQGKLAKLEGVSQPMAVMVHPHIEVHPGVDAKVHVVRDPHKPGTPHDQTVIIERNEVRSSDKPKTVIGEVKTIDPSKPLVELKLGSDDVLVKDPRSKAGQLILGKVKPRSEEKRLEELERTLKKLIDEVDRLKKERASEPSNP
jgi:beta-lactamase regulating signal transducer with metallopeptidase domain